MAEIFVSYRRDDTGILCERVTSRLSARFGERRIFRDANAIYIGSSWEQVLHTALQDCYVVIALIGANWLSARDEQGRQRLFDPHDIVRLELATALTQRKRIIPVLANGARMPQAHELPPDLAPLAQLPPLILRPNPLFEEDMRAIIQVAAPGVRRRVPHPVIALCGIVALVSFASYMSSAAMYTQIPTLYLLDILASPALLLGCVFIIMRSIETRAWGWLAPAVALTPPLIATVIDMLTPLVTSPQGASSAFVILMQVFAQCLAIALTLAFGFFGPRRLAPVRSAQGQLRRFRWMVAACAGVASVTLAIIVVGYYALGLTELLMLFTIADFLCLNSALLGAGLALVSSAQRRRWWWSAGFVAAAMALIGGQQLSHSHALPSALNGPALYSGVALTIIALDCFALCSDRMRTRTA